MMWPINFEEMYKISTYSLRLNGAHPNIKKKTKFWYFKIYLLRFIELLCCGLLFNSIIFYDVVSKKYTEAIKNGLMVIVGITVIFKHSILINYNESIKRLIKILDEDYKAAELYEEKEKDIILKSAMSGVKICRFWLVSATLTSFMFPAKAIIEMINLYMKGEFKLVPMFDFTYPNIIEVHKDSTVAYIVLFLLCLSFDLFSLSMYIGFDPLVPIFMLHTCGQLELISNKLMNLFSKDASRQDIMDELKSINVKLQNIYK
ncbi:unnamed protein product [Danaus chrysippus]|uniref:(African queen) hypothetical protein n=1 Tax=Danaus chrysippus TaxID=151541 RepID=A0A8J2VV43_9NEOP|nr:unnamed protein product [Danaus chrysippus]